jgi:hypothetical protein
LFADNKLKELNFRIKGFNRSEWGHDFKRKARLHPASLGDWKIILPSLSVKYKGFSQTKTD